jgi:hypothetical protein
VTSKNKHIVQGISGDSKVKVRGSMAESQGEIDIRVDNGESLSTNTYLNFSDDAKSAFLAIEGVPSTI